MIKGFTNDILKKQLIFYFQRRLNQEIVSKMFCLYKRLGDMGKLMLSCSDVMRIKCCLEGVGRSLSA